MGSVMSTRNFKNCSEAELLAKITKECERARDESGSSYSGDWGAKDPNNVEIVDKRFFCAYSANAWLEDNLDKSGPIKAVKFLVNINYPETPEIDSEIKSLKKEVAVLESVTGERDTPLENSIVPYSVEALAHIINDGVDFATCHNCGSNIAVGHIELSKCPVCSAPDFILGPDDLIRIDELNVQVGIINGQIDRLKRKRANFIMSKATKKSDWRWFVGAECQW